MKNFISSYRKTITFYLALSACISFVFAVNSSSSNMKALTFFLILLIVLLRLDLYLSRLNELNKCVMIYHTDCNPDPLYDEVIKQLETVKSYSYKCRLLINQAVCFREKGEIKRSYQILKSLNINKCIFTSAKVTYYINLSDLLTLMNKYDKAIICLQQASQIASRVKFKRISNFYIDNIELAKQEINVSHFNKFDGVEEFYLNQLNNASNIHRICILKFNLGVLFLKQNRKEEAHECLKYVIEHGNKMFIVNKATELITDLKVNKE